MGDRLWVIGYGFNVGAGLVPAQDSSLRQSHLSTFIFPLSTKHKNSAMLCGRFAIAGCMAVSIVERTEAETPEGSSGRP